MGIVAPLPFPAYSRRIWFTIGLQGRIPSVHDRIGYFATATRGVVPNDVIPRYSSESDRLGPWRRSRRMQRNRFAEMQIIPILGRNEEGGPTADFSRKHGMSNANFWKAKLRPLLPLLTACAVVICYVATREGGLEGGLTLPASAQSPAGLTRWPSPIAVVCARSRADRAHFAGRSGGYTRNGL